MALELDAARLRENPDLVRLNATLKDTSCPVARAKYRNCPTRYAGRLYASKKEAHRANELDLAKAAGSVIAWWPQVAFPIAGGKYVADFVVLLVDLTVRVEDTKGYRTQLYKLKRKLFKEKYGREIVEI